MEAIDARETINHYRNGFQPLCANDEDIAGGGEQHIVGRGAHSSHIVRLEDGRRRLPVAGRVIWVEIDIRAGEKKPLINK